MYVNSTTYTEKQTSFSACPVVSDAERTGCDGFRLVLEMVGSVSLPSLTVSIDKSAQKQHMRFLQTQETACLPQAIRFSHHNTLYF